MLEDRIIVQDRGIDAGLAALIRKHCFPRFGELDSRSSLEDVVVD